MWPFFAAWLPRYEGQSLLLNIGMAMFISKQQQQQQQQQNKTKQKKPTKKNSPTTLQTQLVSVCTEIY